MDMKLELIILPVTDVDRARDFYADQLGFTVDHDQVVSEEIRFVQLTPPGSACSIAIGTGIVQGEPGSVKGLQMVVADARAAREELIAHGIDAGEIQEFDWGTFTGFRDPDGNEWAVQQLPNWR